MKKGAIFFTGKYGSTRQYAQWLSEATGLPVFDLNKDAPNPDDYDFLILGSSIIVMKPTISKWLNANGSQIQDKPVLLYTVSGTEPGHPNLQKWLRSSLPPEIMENVIYVPLRGRLNMKTLPWLVRISLKIAALMERDTKAKKRMREGFDFMDQSSIAPIVQWVADIQNKLNETTKAKKIASKEVS